MSISIAFADDALVFSAHTATAYTSLKVQSALSRQQIDARLRNFELSLKEDSWERAGSAIVPRRIEEICAETDGSVVLITTDETDKYPWERLFWNTMDDPPGPFAAARVFIRKPASAPGRSASRPDPLPPAVLVAYGTPLLEKEARSVADLFTEAPGYEVHFERMTRVDALLDRLSSQAFKVVFIASHATYREVDGEGSEVVLLVGDEAVPGNRMVSAMREPPDVVFLACSYLGGLAGRLLAVGVKVVIAAIGNLEADLRNFLPDFFEDLLRGASMADAILHARNLDFATSSARPDGTWSALQCYGDPAYRLIRAEGVSGDEDDVAQLEDVDAVEGDVAFVCYEAGDRDAAWSLSAALEEAGTLVPSSWRFYSRYHEGAFRPLMPNRVKALIRRAMVFIVLVSSRLMRSPACQDEIGTAIEAGVPVCPVLLDDCDWESSVLGRYRAAPHDPFGDVRPVTTWADAPQAWSTVIPEIVGFTPHWASKGAERGEFQAPRPIPTFEAVPVLEDAFERLPFPGSPDVLTLVWLAPDTALTYIPRSRHLITSDKAASAYGYAVVDVFSYLQSWTDRGTTPTLEEGAGPFFVDDQVQRISRREKANGESTALAAFVRETSPASGSSQHPRPLLPLETTVSFSAPAELCFFLGANLERVEVRIGRGDDGRLLLSSRDERASRPEAIGGAVVQSGRCVGLVLARHTASQGGRLVAADAMTLQAALRALWVLRAQLGFSPIEARFLADRGSDKLTLDQADMAGANVPGIRLQNTSLRCVNLAQANMADARIDDTDLQGASFFRAILDRAILNSVDLRGADLNSASLREAKLANVDLADSKLQSALLPGASLDSVDLSRADLSRADLTGARLADVDLSGANLTNALLVEASLRSINLVSAKLERADLSRANLSGARLTEANLAGAVLRDASLAGADLTRADLTRADLRGANLSRTALRGARFHGAMIENCSFGGANWDHTTFDDEQRTSPSVVAALQARLTEAAPTSKPETDDGFYSEQGMLAAVLRSDRLAHDHTIVGQLLLLATPRQRSWAVVTSRSLVLVLDDDQTRSAGRIVQRVMPLAGALPVDVAVDASGTGTIRFGESNQPRWLYSPSLFASPDLLKDAFTDLLSKAAESDQRSAPA